MSAISESNLWKKRLGDWVVNPYIGCEHGCLHCYCPAMPGVKFFNGGRAQTDWGHYIIPKPDFVARVTRELKHFTPDRARRTDWGDGWVLLSFLTDCYTPVEAEHKITRRCLQLILEAGHKVRIQTRSALVERDFDILRAHRDRVLLGTSLPYLDDALARVLEPRATGPTRRLEMLRRARAAGLQVYLAVAPVMPFTPLDQLVGIIRHGLELDAREIFCEVLNPKGENLAMMKTALQADGRWVEHTRLEQYDIPDWSRKTYDVLHAGRTLQIDSFTPWPDTGRRWAKHLQPVEAEWLDQFLPPGRQTRKL